MKGILWTQLHHHGAVDSFTRPPLLYFVIVLRNPKLLNRSRQKSSRISKFHLLPALNHQINYIWHWPICAGWRYELYLLPNTVLGCSLYSAGQMCQQHTEEDGTGAPLLSSWLQ